MTGHCVGEEDPADAVARTRAKTDAVDARMLARMGARLALPPDPPASEARPVAA